MMRALGFKRRDALAGFLVESLLLGTTGGVLGTLGAIAMKLVHLRRIGRWTSFLRYPKPLGAS